MYTPGCHTQEHKSNHLFQRTNNDEQLVLIAGNVSILFHARFYMERGRAG